MTTQDKINIVLEAIEEARRLNKAAGRTVYNPAALDALRALHEELEAETEAA